MAKVGGAPESMRGAQIVSQAGEADAESVEQPASIGRRVWEFLRGPYPTLFSRLVLGGIFLLYGLSKLKTPLQFANDIDAYQMGIPPFIVDTMARVLPIVEIGLGIWLLVGLFTRFSAIVASVLLTIFTIAITQAWFRGIDANCGCVSLTGGNSDLVTQIYLGITNALGPVGAFLRDEAVGPVPVIRDLIFLLMALHLIFVPTTFALDDLRRRYSRRTVEVE